MQPSFRYRKIGYVALNVTDLARSVPYYTDIVGLDLSAQSDGGPVFLRCGRDHHNIVLYQAAEPGLKRVAFELATSADLAEARLHIEGLGLAVVPIDADELHVLQQQDGFRFEEPNSSLVFEFYTKMLQMALPFQARLTKIIGLGHLVLSLEKYDEAIAFLTERLGFRVSDYVHGRFAFMRCHPNPLHHSLAVARSNGGNRLHHVNFMVADVDDIGIAMNRMLRNKVEIVFGPGRHQPSTSIFLYFLDPDGLTLEYSFGMEEITDETHREPRMLEPRPEALDMWGGLPAPNFGKVGKIEART